ncbi:MFS transporter [Krasilnikovia sp. M28-CT-15]|uniref:MFS transporter n=1 Tax=Krasilnikovia sp. M28-CT-15 TaxID=3373540 RepID=UPI0038776D49
MSSRNGGRPPLALLCSAQFMLTLDFAIVNVALPAMHRDLGFTSGSLPWVIGAYALFFGGFLLLGGRAGDLFGRKRMFVAGLVVFTLASLIGGLATVPIVLILARALQGLSAAAVSPAVLALIAAGYPEPGERAKAMGVFGAVASAGFAGGVLAGGILTETLGWRSVMYVNVPVGILLVVAALRKLAPDHQGHRVRRVDVPGALLITGAFCLFSYALTVAADKGWGAGSVIWPIVAGVVLLGAFLILETRVKEPLVSLGIFKIRSVTGGNAVAFLSGGVMSISTFCLTLYMQQILGYSSIKTGLAFFPQAFVVVLASLPVAKMTVKYGPRPVLVGGAVFLLAGSLWLTQASGPDSYLSHVLPGGVLLGLGVTVMMITTAFAATTGVPPQQMGLASGLYNSLRQLGVGLLLSIAVAIAGLGALGSGVDNFKTAFSLSAGLSVVIAVVSALLVPGRRSAPAVAPTSPAPAGVASRDRVAVSD